MEEGWRVAKRLTAPRITFSAIEVDPEAKTYAVRQLIISQTLGDLMLDMPPRVIKAIYEKCLMREKNGYTALER